MKHHILVTVEAESNDADAIKQEIQSNLEYEYDRFGIESIVVSSLPAELVERLEQETRVA